MKQFTIFFKSLHMANYAIVAKELFVHEGVAALVDDNNEICFIANLDLVSHIIRDENPSDKVYEADPAGIQGDKAAEILVEQFSHDVPF